MRPVALTEKVPAWLGGTGPEAGIVLSSRVRLARNLAGRTFPHRADSLEASRIFDDVAGAISESGVLAGGTVFDFTVLEPRDRRVLVERHLASPRLERSGGARGVLVEEEEARAIMINEEDHVRIQSLTSGLDLQEALRVVVELDRGVEEVLEYAVDPRWGYLTACPTNVGTGLRASVQLHLPGLVLAGEMKRIHRAVAQMGMAVRGWFGEGSRALGDLYQVSNQRTLGSTEEESVETMERVARRALELERGARERLMASEESQWRLTDRICRSWATLRSARLLTDEQAMACVSDARLGADLGLLEGLEPGEFNRMALLHQPAHLGGPEENVPEGTEADWLRAGRLRAWSRGHAEPEQEV